MANRPLLTAVSLAAVAAAALGIYVALDWYASSPADEAATGEIVDQGQSNLESMQQALEAEIAQLPRSEVQERLESPLGQALFRKCSEWIEFYDNHPDEEILEHRDKACGEYREYVENGTLPPSPTGSS